MKPDLYIEQTLDALAGWQPLCRELGIDPEQRKVIQRAFDEIRNRFG